MMIHRVDDRFGICFDLIALQPWMEDNELMRRVFKYGHWGGMTWAVAPMWYWHSDTFQSWGTI